MIWPCHIAFMGIIPWFCTMCALAIAPLIRQLRLLLQVRSMRTARRALGGLSRRQWNPLTKPPATGRWASRFAMARTPAERGDTEAPALHWERPNQLVDPQEYAFSSKTTG